MFYHDGEAPLRRGGEAERQRNNRFAGSGVPRTRSASEPPALPIARQQAQQLLTSS
jgi:hypothetical protein